MRIQKLLLYSTIYFLLCQSSMHVHDSTTTPACAFLCSCISSITCMCCGPLVNGRGYWHRREELLNKVIIFVFFVHKKFSLGFIKLRLNRWCHIDYFNNVLTTFLALKVLVVLLSTEGQKALGFHQKYLNLCSEDERRSCHVGVSNYWPNFHFCVNYPFKIHWIKYLILSQQQYTTEYHKRDTKVS